MQAIETLRTTIIDQVKSCQDEDLLDLIIKLLICES
jgi:hypothetical protein